MKMLVPQKNLQVRPHPFFLLRWIANLTITSMVFLFVLADVMVWVYQQIYFRVSRIPMIPRGEYVIVTRHHLKKLTLIQKWSCAYCEYVNGVIAWVKAVANQTEIYSCAIKYTHEFPGQEYQSDFYDPEEFSAPAK